MRPANGGGRPPGWRRPLAYACLLVPFGALLWIPAYARSTPELAGLPFFYWYQLMWVLLTPALMSIAYVLLHRGRREVRS